MSDFSQQADGKTPEEWYTGLVNRPQGGSLVKPASKQEMAPMASEAPDAKNGFAMPTFQNLVSPSKPAMRQSAQPTPADLSGYNALQNLRMPQPEKDPNEVF